MRETQDVPVNRIIQTIEAERIESQPRRRQSRGKHSARETHHSTVKLRRSRNGPLLMRSSTDSSGGFSFATIAPIRRVEPTSRCPWHRCGPRDNGQSIAGATRYSDVSNLFWGFLASLSLLRRGRERRTSLIATFNLAPDLQEGHSVLPHVEQGKDPASSRSRGGIVWVIDYREQRRMWGIPAVGDITV